MQLSFVFKDFKKYAFRSDLDRRQVCVRMIGVCVHFKVSGDGGDEAVKA